MIEVSVLPFEYEECLIKCKQDMFKKHSVEEKFKGSLIRGDILELLDKFCTVVYYPIKNEKNHGFHIKNVPLYNGEKKNFVFINTAHTIEKQAFTAAHELGHIWKVDEYVVEHMKLTDCDEKLSEDIISRFAAIMLMPRKEFVSSATEILKTMGIYDGQLDFMGVLKVIVMLMYKFFAPKKSVILRLVEVGLMSEKSAKLLLEKGDERSNYLDIIINQIISDLGYVEFQKATEKRWIEGLSDILNLAEKSGCVSQSKIDNMRKLFELDKHISVDSKEIFMFNTFEGADHNAT